MINLPKECILIHGRPTSAHGPSVDHLYYQFWKCINRVQRGAWDRIGRIWSRIRLCFQASTYSQFLSSPSVHYVELVIFLCWFHSSWFRWSFKLISVSRLLIGCDACLYLGIDLKTWKVILQAQMDHRCKTLVDVAYSDDETFPGYEFMEFSPDGEECKKYDIDWTECPRKALRLVQLIS